MSGYLDKVRARKRAEADSVLVPIINKITPGGYTLKTPAFFDFYEGEFPLDWDAIVAAAPMRLIFQITVGRHGRHGNDEMDYAVQSGVLGSITRGQKYGLYHLLEPNSITEQCDFYCRSVDVVGGWGQMSPILDIEYEPPRGRDTFRGVEWGEQIKYALDLLEQRSGEKPLLYWSRKFIGYTLDRAGNTPYWMKDYWHWLAGYPWTPYVDANPTLPAVYRAQGITEENWCAWQYAEDGRYRGKPANDLSLVSYNYSNYLAQRYGG